MRYGKGCIWLDQFLTHQPLYPYFLELNLFIFPWMIFIGWCHPKFERIEAQQIVQFITGLETSIVCIFHGRSKFFSLYFMTLGWVHTTQYKNIRPHSQNKSTFHFEIVENYLQNKNIHLWKMRNSISLCILWNIEFDWELSPPWILSIYLQKIL